MTDFPVNILLCQGPICEMPVYRLSQRVFVRKCLDSIFVEVCVPQKLQVGVHPCQVLVVYIQRVFGAARSL